MSEFESFDYTKVTVAENQMSQYMDGYEHFGWKVDSNVPIEKGMGKVTIHLKRSRAVLSGLLLFPFLFLWVHWKRNGKSNNPLKAEQGSFK